jgi:hypothetical protein
MKKITITGTSVAQDTNNIAAAVTASSGVAFTLITDKTPDALAHKLIITPSGSVTGNYGISGLDANGVAVSETLATNTTNAVTSASYYSTGIIITAPAGLGAETVDIGYTAESITDTRGIQPGGNIGFGCIVASGSPTYTVQHTYDNSNWFDHATVAAETTSQEGTYSAPIAGMRIKFTAAGGVTLTGYQAI